MRLLNTLLVILTVGIASAQESVLTISQISHGDHTYTHIKGDDNGAENCFTATSSMTLAMSVDGLSVDNIYINNEPFSWAGPGGEALAISFGDWDDYNRVYRNRGSQRPIRDTSTNLLYCGGWSLGADGQTYSNDAFDDYTYNSFDGASGTIGGYIYFQGTRIQFNGFAATRELLEDLIETAIADHMRPVEAWNRGYDASRNPSWAYTNANFPGYWYVVSQPLTNKWSFSVYTSTGRLHQSWYPNFDTSEADARSSAESYIAGLSSSSPLDFNSFFDGTSGEWFMTVSPGAAGSTSYRWTNPATSRQITHNTYQGISQLWNIEPHEDGEPVARLLAASTHSTYQAAISWGANLIRVSESGSDHVARIAAQNALKRDIAAIIIDRSLRQQVNFEVTSVRLWSVVGHASTRDISISIDDHGGSVSRVQSAYDAMVTTLQNARNGGHLND